MTPNSHPEMPRYQKDRQDLLADYNKLMLDLKATSNFVPLISARFPDRHVGRLRRSDTFRPLASRA